MVLTLGHGVDGFTLDREVVRNRPHEMASNPHPQHGSCPSLEAGLGTIAAGQTRVTHNFANAGSCGYHDHLNDATASLKGTITVQ